MFCLLNRNEDGLFYGDERLMDGVWRCVLSACRNLEISVCVGRRIIIRAGYAHISVVSGVCAAGVIRDVISTYSVRHVILFFLRVSFDVTIEWRRRTN
mmetsp:Transcript_267/g.363  ORF Transcript_267/g.363 Transcript_267/m.363 type:complete len:98 (-) Transcript_267:55-348(-)